jgi:hypothetical protein
MPSPLLVAGLVFIAALSLLLSPMPPRVCWLTAAAFALVGIVFLCSGIGIISPQDEITLLRYAVSGLAGVVILTFVTWKVGGQKAWRR